ncbi:putative lipase domain protein [Trypanosoma rangeli]|uniref:sn-1-specific diacylglycerol lipase n=1 Tax=Trypanosoma rangeli TaxID=5698 RepID=A0A3R7KUA8_TRYRA|nr:putative lipase domain protein [Trypanosoma rangeli]RNF09854.1 putative lipase domain protein [Trypanosoma rangeli]|eukprot:RNF09854.1 putative lipase domain protein [Trypanosoma rangeli]
MPALHWCGRKWRTSTDDFAFSSVFFFAFLVVSGTLAVSRFHHGDGAFIRDCPGASLTLHRTFLALGIVDLIGAVAFLVLAWLSLQGSPFQVSKRRRIPHLLSVTSLSILAMLVLSSVVTKHTIYDMDSKYCANPTRRFLYVVVIFNFFVSFCYGVMFAVVFDPVGRRVWMDSVEYESLWYARCRVFCCCLYTRHNKDVFEDVSRNVAGLFCGYDIVPSDVAAGMLLVHNRQKCELHLRRLNVQYPPAPDGKSERISLQARHFLPLSEKQRRQLADIRTYSRFYLSAYGWPLFEYMHCCTGLSRLCCFDPRMCCRGHAGSHRGTRCCDLTTILKVTGIRDEDVILTRWENAPFRPVFFVVIDQSTDSVIVGIRGTMSFADCVTDMVATPGLLEMPETELEANTTHADYHVHGGMQKCAAYVLQELRECGVLDCILHGEFSRRKVVVLGHSLGAGVASILSIMLWSTEVTLRSRLQCLAYAPPGGLLSPALVAYSKEFIVGCFVGNDIIPHMASHTLYALRESILDELMKTSKNKSLLFMGHRRLAKPMQPPLASSACHSSESITTRNNLFAASSSLLTEPKKLYPPATLIHYRKAVVRNTSCYCCCSSKQCCCQEEEVFVPLFESPQDVQCVVCAASMLRDHFPDRLFSVIEEADRRLNVGELERFFVTSEDVRDARVNYGTTTSDNMSSLV